MKTIKVLGETYRVVFKKNLMESEGLEGYADPHNYLIVVDASLKGRARLKAFWHEVGHAFAFESGLHEFLSADAREMFAQTFSVFLCQLMKKKNP